MEVLGIETGPLAENCYLLWGQGPKAVVIDPGDDAPAILNALAERELSLQRILLTHGHIDHIAGLNAVRERYPVPVDLHPLDEAWAFGEANQLPPYHPPPSHPCPIDRHLAEGQMGVAAGYPFRVLELPGHTPGGVGFYFEAEKVLLSGDTLFRGGVGRTDLPGGDPAALQRSLRRLRALPPETRVYPGHGPDTTLALEFATNPWLRD